jgi:hypothetical protein
VGEKCARVGSLQSRSCWGSQNVLAKDEVPLASVNSVGKRQVVCRRMCHSFRAGMSQSDSVQYHRHVLSSAKSGGQIIILRSQEIPFITKTCTKEQ